MKRRGGSRGRAGALGCLLMIASVGFAAAATGKAPVRHTVRRGQTLYSIARLYGVPVSRLAAANGIRNPALVRAGASLLIPRPRSARPASPRSAAPRVPPARNGPIDDPAAEVPARLPPSLSPAMKDTPHRDERLRWPVAGAIISGFDRPRRGHRHQGIDIASEAGTPIRAVADGVVTLATDHHGNYGRLVAIEHDDGMVSYYGHNMRNLVKPGQRVSAEEVIALVGHSGNASCDHLHFELRLNGEAIDPATALASQPSDGRVAE